MREKERGRGGEGGERERERAVIMSQVNTRTKGKTKVLAVDLFNACLTVARLKTEGIVVRGFTGEEDES